MDCNVYYASRQPVINRSNNIAIPYSSVLQSPQNNRNSSTASHDSGYSSSMSNHTSGGSPKQQARNPTQWANTQDWDKYRSVITKLYRDDGFHLKRVQSIMANTYNFTASERMYKTRISKWGLDKNLKAHDVMVIYRMNQARAMEGKRSVFTVRGRPMDYSRVEQYLRRDPSIVKRINNADDIKDIPVDHARNAGITCRTPSPSPPGSPSHRPTATGQGQAMPYGSYNGYTQPAQHHDQQQQQQQFMHRQSFAQSAVLPSQAPLGLSVPQMPLPVTTSAMNGFGGIPATSGPSVYGNMYGAPMSPTVSPYSTLVTSAPPNSSAYQLSHPSQYPMGSAAQTNNMTPTNLTPSTPSTTLSMVPQTGNTPRTIDADVRSYSFAPMPSYVEPGQAAQGQMINGHDQFNGGRVQQHQQHHYPQPQQQQQQQQHQQHHYPQPQQNQQASPIAKRPNGPNGQSAPGVNGSSSLAEQYGWNLDPNGQWDASFQ